MSGWKDELDLIDEITTPLSRGTLSRLGELLFARDPNLARGLLYGYAKRADLTATTTTVNFTATTHLGALPIRLAYDGRVGHVSAGLTPVTPGGDGTHYLYADLGTPDVNGLSAVTLVASSTAPDAEGTANRMPLGRAVVAGGIITELESFHGSAAVATAPSPTLPRGYLAGLGLSNAADADHDITVAVGTCRNNDDDETLELASTLTKQIDAIWAEGDGAGGLDTGSVASGSVYHVHLIKDTGSGTVDALFSLSPAAPTMPSGYTKRRRIGIVRTDGSANIFPFVQVGDHVILKSPLLDVNTTTLGATDTTFTLSVTGVSVLARLNLYVTNAGSSGMVYVHHPDTTDLTPSETVSPLATLKEGQSARPAAGMAEIRTNASGQIKAKAAAASTTFRAALLGWFDRRGQDG